MESNRTKYAKCTVVICDASARNSIKASRLSVSGKFLATHPGDGIARLCHYHFKVAKALEA